MREEIQETTVRDSLEADCQYYRNVSFFRSRAMHHCMSTFSEALMRALDTPRPAHDSTERVEQSFVMHNPVLPDFSVVATVDYSEQHECLDAKVEISRINYDDDDAIENRNHALTERARIHAHRMLQAFDQRDDAENDETPMHAVRNQLYDCVHELTQITLASEKRLRDSEPKPTPVDDEAILRLAYRQLRNASQTLQRYSCAKKFRSSVNHVETVACEVKNEIERI